MVEIHFEQTIAPPVDRVFHWLAEPAGLGFAPMVGKARPVYAGGKLIEAASQRLLRSGCPATLAACAKAVES